MLAQAQCLRERDARVCVRGEWSVGGRKLGADSRQSGVESRRWRPSVTFGDRWLFLSSGVGAGEVAGGEPARGGPLLPQGGHRPRARRGLLQPRARRPGPTSASLVLFACAHAPGCFRVLMLARVAVVLERLWLADVVHGCVVLRGV
eukprot:553897-Rhodomonas_salina.2